MDTKLKKSHKLKKWIIAMIVLLPAFILVSLYPQMEQSMLERKEELLEIWRENATDYAASIEQMDVSNDGQVEKTYYLQDNFVNYVIEASYYQYASMLRDTTGKDVFTDALDAHGWINDYYELTETTPYYIEYTSHPEDDFDVINITDGTMSYDISAEEANALLNGIEIVEPRKTQLKSHGLLGYLIVEYDSYGKISNIRMNVEDNVVYDSNIYLTARESVLQYENNATYYVQETADVSVNLEKALEICPKNFKGIYFIYDSNERFVNHDWQNGTYIGNPYEYEPYYQPHDLYLSTGAYVIVALCALFVLLAAMILPFFKKMETGWEKLFSIPFEFALLLTAAGIALAFGMCILMSITTMTEITTYLSNQPTGIQLLGYRFSAEQCYQMLLVVNFLGWALAFFMEYICVANLRQFISKPVYYIKHRFFVSMIIRWFIQKLADLQMQKKFQRNIIFIALINLGVISLCCCLRFVGIILAVPYCILIYFVMKKWGEKQEAQYQSILSKAVVEVSKSQQMKTELISNVSHDLKTPLTAIITYIDLLKNPEITVEERASYIETLDLKSQRLKVLIEDLFEISKANSGNVTMNFLDVDVVQLLKEVRVEMSDQIEASNLDFRFHLPEEKIILSLDGQRTYRIFENLLNNAIKYAMPFTRVYVDVADNHSEVTITFKNMSAKELNFDAEYLTERFVRGDSSRNSEGSGLGLAIAKSFTELQHGTMNVQIDGDLFKVTICFPKQA